jgi:ribosome-associated heat shock protein Hsp15
MERVRIDRWLWAARFFKTRSAATDAVAGGHVQIGGERVKPAKEVRVGNTLEIRRGEIRWTVVVTGVTDRRGSATVAAALYEETAESLAARERERLERRVARPLGADLGERPTKQARRRIEALRRGQRRR